MEKSLLKFESGKSYWVRSICDCNTIWNFIIISRSKTGKTITVKDIGDKNSYEKRCKVKVYKSKTYGDREYIKPLGDHSMSPILSADNEVKDNA